MRREAIAGIALALAQHSSAAAHRRLARIHRYDQAIAQAVDASREVYPEPPALVRAVIHQESDFNPRAVSKAGAIGSCR
jgi:soluble lytic murein transglycosylase-like protein